jgi:hypothetical protein
MIITLCGSNRFEPYFHAWNLALTLAGHTVFSLTAFPSQNGGIKEWYTPEMKAELDAAHARKIVASDAIFVINRHAYIGESTMKEIDVAKASGKKIYAMESWGKGCGISTNHYKEIVTEAQRILGVYNYGSPVDTFPPLMKDPWNDDLLGDAGPVRRAIVKVVGELANLALDKVCMSHEEPCDGRQH